MRFKNRYNMKKLFLQINESINVYNFRMSLSKYKNPRINLGKLVQMILDIESQVNIFRKVKFYQKVTIVKNVVNHEIVQSTRRIMSTSNVKNAKESKV